MPYRELFPACSRYAYLNAAAVAPASTRVQDAVARAMSDLVEHGVVHEREWEREAEATRSKLATLVGADPSEICFVRNTSHGLSLVAEGLDWRPGDEVAVAAELEYPSNVYAWQHLASRGVSIRPIVPENGGVTVRAARAAMTPKTRLIAVSAVQYATGHRTNLAELGALARQSGVLLSVDGIQQVGAEPIDVKAAGVHFLSADSHKWMLGMPGIGFAFVDRAVLPSIRPPAVGWKSTAGAWNFDESRFELRSDAAKLEEGSPPYALIAGLGAAVDLLLEAQVSSVAAHIRGIHAQLEEVLAPRGVRFGPAPEDRAGILTLELPGDVREAALAARAHGVIVSVRRGRLRISPHLYTDDSDVRALVEVVAPRGAGG